MFSIFERIVHVRQLWVVQHGKYRAFTLEGSGGFNRLACAQAMHIDLFDRNASLRVLAIVGKVHSPKPACADLGEQTITVTKKDGGC